MRNQNLGDCPSENFGPPPAKDSRDYGCGVGWEINRYREDRVGYLFGISSYNFILNRLINKEVQGLYSKTNKHRDCSPKGRSKVA